jgi:hypothetical protein
MFAFCEPGSGGSWADDSNHFDYVVVVFVLLRFGSPYQECKHWSRHIGVSTYEKKPSRCV